MRETDTVSGPINLAERKLRFAAQHAQQSTVWMRRQQAVCVRRAYKKYGEKKNPNVILDGLNMTVPKGCIYGLLGASGCGKTTLLSCIVGRKRLNAGEIWVLGGKPGSAGSGVPGPRVGYMPQEVALNKGFSIREAMIYFGWINGMTTKEVNEKVDFFVRFLQLPSADRIIMNLSGGQQRRVSLACVLVHEPELLILDEPTVGVDPVLRQNIWDHMVKIAKELKTTIIITTHYIDETRQANMIGLMRGGRLLAEEPPEYLLQKYSCVSLEEVFLKLSIIQNRGKRRRSSILHDVTASINVPDVPLGLQNAVSMNTAFDNSSEISGEFGEIIGQSSISKRVSLSISSEHAHPPSDLPPNENRRLTLFERLKPCQLNHMRALIWKNVLWMWRNAAIMTFVIGLPVFQIILFNLSIGKDPIGLHLAIVNNEPLNKTSICPIIVDSCTPETLSCKYLYYLQQRNQVLDNYKSLNEAKKAVVAGKAWAAINFQSNFSTSLQERFDNGRNVDDETIMASEIQIWMDQSNQQISQLLQRDLVLSLQDFTQAIAVACNISSKVLQVPMRFNKPIYGDTIPNFTDFAAPGIILTIIFFLAVALTSGAMLTERNEGILERSLVSGITGTEILMSHVICEFIIMLFQSIMVMLFSFWIFQVTINGFVITVFSLIILTGLCGMSYGFVVSCITDTERNATYLALGSFLPMVMLCGVIWPVEGMHPWLRPISFFLPLTFTTESLRSVLIRGWGVFEPVVYCGFLATIAWIIIFLSSSVLLIKFKKG